MEIWQLFFLGPLAITFLLWLMAPVLLLAIPAYIIIAIKKYHRKEDIDFNHVHKALGLTVLCQLFIYAIVGYCLPIIWQPSPAYISTAVTFFASQVIGFIIMIYLLSHFQATTSPEDLKE